MVKRKREGFEFREEDYESTTTQFTKLELERLFKMKEQQGSSVVFLSMWKKELGIQTLGNIYQYFLEKQSSIRVVVINNFSGISDEAVCFLERIMEYLNLETLKLEGFIPDHLLSTLESFDVENNKLQLLPAGVKIPKRSLFDSIFLAGPYEDWGEERYETHVNEFLDTLNKLRIEQLFGGKIPESTANNVDKEHSDLLNELRIGQLFEEAKELKLTELEIVIDDELNRSIMGTVAMKILCDNNITRLILDFKGVLELPTAKSLVDALLLLGTLSRYQSIPLTYLNLKGGVSEEVIPLLNECKRDGLTPEINGQEITLPSTAPQKTRSAEKIIREEEIKYQY